MKSPTRILLAFAAIISMIACTSKEKKAEALIKDYLFKTMYDFDSYQVVETKVDSAFFSPYTDDKIMAVAAVANEASKESNSHMQKALSALRSMNTWSDSYSSYGQSQYYRYRDEGRQELKAGKTSSLIHLNSQKEIKKMAAELPDGFMGWEVSHSFRCKTKGGFSELKHYIFITDPRFKTILYKEDIEDEDIIAQKKEIQGALEITEEQYDQLIAETEAIRAD
jgi:hypothetical protein